MQQLKLLALLDASSASMPLGPGAMAVARARNERARPAITRARPSGGALRANVHDP